MRLDQPARLRPRRTRRQPPHSPRAEGATPRISSCSSTTSSASWSCPAAPCAPRAAGRSRPAPRTSPTEGRDRFDLDRLRLPAISPSTRCHGDADGHDRALAPHRRAAPASTAPGRSDRRGEWQPRGRGPADAGLQFRLVGRRACHYLARARRTRCISASANAPGDANRAGRRYRMTNVDAMGYNARDHRPALQAHPVLHHLAPRHAGRASACSTTPCPTARSTWAASCDNYHGLYRCFVAESRRPRLLRHRRRQRRRRSRAASPG